VPPGSRPTGVAEELEETHHIAPVGLLAGIREPYCATGPKRRARHEGVESIVEVERTRLLTPE
jgi:hypothetical protein